ncbi:MAG: hypothetical protein EZS28_004192 [Streblomastix strix]|uniref:Tyr recombinase domain-containing protein n=1 Tax=Streblomastix strix TaxID=222440 RepID=A0A5J4WZK9_9EUKA|nr:MAG: hypothetical protein EZS28_004192 [Streblomastix strix]
MFATKSNAKCTIYYSPTQEEAAAGTGGLQAVCIETSNSKQLHSSGDSDGLAESMVVTTTEEHGIRLDYSGQFRTNIQRRPLNEAQKNETTSRKSNTVRDKNWRGDIIFNQLAIAKRLQIEEQESLIKEMGPNLWRTRRAALSNLDVYLKSKNKKASSLLRGNVVLNVRRALDGMQKMGKSNQQMIAIRRGICSIFSLLINSEDFTRNPLIQSFMKPIVSGIIKKPRYSKAWNISKLLDFESLKSNEKTQQNVMLHALELLESHSTLRGTELASITRKQITVDTDCIKIIVSKRKAKNGGRQIIIRPRLDKTICPYGALSKWIEMLNNRFSNQNSVQLNKRNLQTSDQGVRDLLRTRIRQAGISKEYGSNTIRHSVMTQLRKSNLSLEQVNKLTDHAPGSIVVDEYYNKPDHPLSIDDFISLSVPATLVDAPKQPL